MAAVGGSIQEVGIRGRIFAVAGDAEAHRTTGGTENDVQANGNGSARIIKTRVPLSIKGLMLEIDDLRGDMEFLQDIADGNGYVPITITYVSGATYAATAMITGEFQHQSTSTTAPVDLVGPGKLVKQ